MVKKKRISKRVTRSRIRRFNPLTFKNKDTFFWDITKFINFIYGIFDFDDLKPNVDEILFIKELIDELDNKSDKKSGIKYKEIKILPVFKNIFDSMSKYNNPKGDSLTEDIKSIIESYEPSNAFYIKDIQKDLVDKRNKHTTSKKIYNILKRKLGLRFLSTLIKNKSLNKNKSKLMTFMFIKILIRALQMGISPIFLDETGFMIQNNSYKRWRLPKKDCNIGPCKNVKKKANLLLAVSSKNVILEKFTSENTNENIFIEFLNDLFEKIELNERKKFIIIMDNATIHKTQKIIKLCLKSKIKVLTIIKIWKF